MSSGQPAHHARLHGLLSTNHFAPPAHLPPPPPACSGSLVQDYGPRPVFACTAVFPLLVSAAAVVIPEDKTYYGSEDLGGC